MTTDESGGSTLEFQRGPVFTQLLLADEINRATPKTQSALLECMQEGSVTAGGDTYTLAQPFFVLATQNPLEHEGTYRLPEAQLDRFLFRVDVPFLDRETLNEVMNRTMLRERHRPERVLDGPRVLQMREVLRKVVVADPVRDYAVRLVLASHPENLPAVPGVKKYVRWGASPRAAQALIAAGRVRALAHGRVHLSCEDVRYFAREVFQHRIILNYDGQAEDIFAGDLIGELVEHTGEQA
jgi:MoxR-like ATPase